MTKVVYNSCFGGFGLSKKALARYAEIKGISNTKIWESDIPRADPALVQVVEEMMDPVTKESDASGSFGELQIRDVPEGMRYFIEEYDGMERVVTEPEFHWEVA